MKGYWIARVTVTDPEQYKFYAEATPEAFGKYNGRILARGGRAQKLEGRGGRATWSLSSPASRTRSPATTRRSTRLQRPSARTPARPTSSLSKASERP